MIMKQFLWAIVFALLFFTTSVAAEKYSIELSTTPEKVIARDNPFAHYEDLGALPSLEITVTENNQPVEDVTIAVTVTHIDNLLLPSGFPWVQGKELLSLTNFEEDGTATVDALLFPLRGDYTVDVKVRDDSGYKQSEQFTIKAAEPFWQSTFNGLIFLSALLLFGFIVGIVFGKNIFASKRAQGKIGVGIGVGFLCIFLLLLVQFVLAHGAEEVEETGIVHYEDAQMIFYTSPAVPDIGKETTFTFEALDETGQRVNNAVAYVELANEEEGFVVLELELFSQTGVFSFDYGIFDGAPHIATIDVGPTKTSSTHFASIHREFAFAGTAHNPPFSAKLIATLVMLATMLLGFVLGVFVRKCPRCPRKKQKKEEDSQGGMHE